MGFQSTPGEAYSFFVRGLFGVTFGVYPLRAYGIPEFWRLEFDVTWPREMRVWTWGPMELMLEPKRARKV